MHHLIPTATVALAIASLPPAVSAASLVGSVAGEPREWHVNDVDGESSAKWYDFGGFSQVEIFAFPQPENVRDVSGALSLTLSFMGEPPQVAGASVVYHAGGFSDVFTVDEDEIEVTMREATVEDGVLRLSGTVAAEVFRAESAFSDTLDRDDSLAVTADFDLVLEAQ